MNQFSLTRARSLAEAARASTTVAGLMARSNNAAASGASVVMAGGVDLLDLLKEGVLAPDGILSLRDIPGLDAVSEDADGLRIGAMTTLATLADHPLSLSRAAMLAQAAAAPASLQIRNVATVGGNLLQRPRCWYFRAKEFHCLKKGGDRCFALEGENQYHAVFDNDLCAMVHPSTIATVLVALGARVSLTDAQGAERKVLLEDFFVSPAQDVLRENDLRSGEILTAVELPWASAPTHCAWLKQGERDSPDWPLADVAVALDLDGEQKCARAVIVLGAAAPVPRRATSAERLLIGQVVGGAAVAKEAGRAALDGAAPFARNRYKLPIFEALIERAITLAVAPTGQASQPNVT